MIVVISGPSGVGKTVICRGLIDADPSLVLSVSATTRAPRADEIDGVNYAFWDRDRFREAVDKGYFLEWAEVHGELYGTPREAVEAELARGRSPLLDVDVQGGRSVKRIVPEAVLILLAPPSLEALESRLRGRGTDSDAVIRRRLEAARMELDQWGAYDYVVVNDRLDEALARIRGILGAERARVSRRRPRG
jgi:guanylate kinase